MDPLPPHIRPEDEIFFREPLSLAPMRFRARWVLGLKILIAGQIVWLPFSLFFGFTELLERHMPALAAAPSWGVAVLFFLVACVLFSPLWAAGIFRAWIAQTVVQKLVEQSLKHGAPCGEILLQGADKTPENR